MYCWRHISVIQIQNDEIMYNFTKLFLEYNPFFSLWCESFIKKFNCIIIFRNLFSE